MPARDADHSTRLREKISDSLNLVDFPCQHIDGYNKPEIEVQDSKELVLEPLEIRRHDQERVLVERSINSARISIKLKDADGLELWLRKKRISLLQRTEQLDIVRRKPIAGYDLSFLVTAKHLQVYSREALLSFILHVTDEEFCSENDFKRLIAAKGRHFSATLDKALSVR